MTSTKSAAAAAACPERRADERVAVQGESPGAAAEGKRVATSVTWANAVGSA